MLMPVLQDVRAKAGLDQQEIGFTCSGSTDYLSGQAFSFVSTLDGVGPWPPIQESHVEMDGAWALYEAWVKLQLGEIDTALIYCYGKSSPGPLHEVLSRQLDPYSVGPLWPDAISLAALQARALLDAGKATEADFAEVVARSRRNALDNPNAQLAWDRAAGRPARRGADRRPAPQARLPADHRRRLRGDPRRRRHRPRACASARRGSAASTTASSRWRSASATSPRRPRPGSPGEKAGVGGGADRRRRAARPVHATRS